MLRIAIDCRMIGSGGIGTFISELIPYFLENNECLLIGTHEQCMPFVRMQNVEFCFCDIPCFSLKEIYSFPKEIIKKISVYLGDQQTSEVVRGKIAKKKLTRTAGV